MYSRKKLISFTFFVGLLLPISLVNAAFAYPYGLDVWEVSQAGW
jgi:hypothetical protein